MEWNFEIKFDSRNQNRILPVRTLDGRVRFNTEWLSKHSCEVLIACRKCKQNLNQIVYSNKTQPAVKDRRKRLRRLLLVRWSRDTLMQS